MGEMPATVNDVVRELRERADELLPGLCALLHQAANMLESRRHESLATFRLYDGAVGCSTNALQLERVRAIFRENGGEPVEMYAAQPPIDELVSALRNAHPIIRCEAITNDADLVLREIERVVFNATGEALYGVPSGNPTAPGVPSPLPPVEYTDDNGFGIVEE